MFDPRPMQVTPLRFSRGWAGFDAANKFPVSYGRSHYHSDDRLFQIMKRNGSWGVLMLAESRSYSEQRRIAFASSGLQEVKFPRRRDLVAALETFVASV